MQDSKSYYNKPLDADDVNFRMQHLRVYDLASMAQLGKLDILQDDLDLRKYLDCWTINEKSLFLESLMLKFPVPLFYFDGSDNPWKIVDGIKRIFTILDYIEGKFSLKGLEYLIDEAEGRHFNTLPGYLQTRIMDAGIVAYVINPGTSIRVRYNIFKRINTVGREKYITFGLNRNEVKVRSLFFRPHITPFIGALAQNPRFLLLTSPHLRYNKTEDEIIKREFVTYFLAFQLQDYKDYLGNMDAFLFDAIIKMPYTNSPNQFSEDFERSLKMIEALNISQDQPFFIRSKRNLMPFASLTYTLLLLHFDDFTNLTENKKGFTEEYQGFIEECHRIAPTLKQESVIWLFKNTQLLVDKYIR